MGFEVGAVTAKWVEISQDDETIRHAVVRHEGNPRGALKGIIVRHNVGDDSSVVFTGAPTSAFLEGNYRPEVECVETALLESGLEPDIVLALGGENFVAYALKKGRICDIHSLPKCAAGTGEFFAQQLGRMGMSLEEGLAAYSKGKGIRLATRCSVHLKSDATHKLNRGECTPEDIVYSLIEDLAAKAERLINLTSWNLGHIVLIGGLSRNLPFVEALGNRLKESVVIVPREGSYFEAYGAALLAAKEGGRSSLLVSRPVENFDVLNPLADYEGQVEYRVQEIDGCQANPRDSFVLAVDSGSTTTKAVLVGVRDGQPKASCYLRTNGNPIEATRQCLVHLRQTLSFDPRIVQTATTGSGRELVSVFLDGAPAYNEIIAHGRAAADEADDVGTIFEIGGQDSKYMYLEAGVPIDYTMNEGCSAGTGSFLEESAFVDMSINCEEISHMALRGKRPPVFGERCAAFINTDLRNALGRGADLEDVVAGLVYSIADNYISRVVGTRKIDDTLLFQGGVALNRAVALAIAAQTGSKVIVPRYPELMGAIGAALLVRDSLLGGEMEEVPLSLSRTRRFTERREGDFIESGRFRCQSCENDCEIRKIRVKGKNRPFGGLCSKYSNMRHKPMGKEGVDLFQLRHQLMFSEFAPEAPLQQKGVIGLPRALTTFQLFPLYARFIVELGYHYLLLDPPRRAHGKNLATLCYPAQLASLAVGDLLKQDVDYIFVPSVHEVFFENGTKNQFSCTTTALLGDIIRGEFASARNKLLTPELNLVPSHLESTKKRLAQLSKKLNLDRGDIERAFDIAYQHQKDFALTLRARYDTALEKIGGEPLVVLAGRPYVTVPREINLSIPRKIASRGFHVVPHDALQNSNGMPHGRNCWYETQQIMRAVMSIKEQPRKHLCFVSCFSCSPDAMIFHEIEEALAGRPFCYLEIDSHTADAGIETRIEAFLEIVERGDRPRDKAKREGA